jgi:Fe2+ or Zn2+ uptake regulation protein
MTNRIEETAYRIARYSSNRGLISQIHIKDKKIKCQSNNPMNKGQLTCTDTSKKIKFIGQMPNKYMKKCSTSFAIRDFSKLH